MFIPGFLRSLLGVGGDTKSQLTAADDILTGGGQFID